MITWLEYVLTHPLKSPKMMHVCARHFYTGFKFSWHRRQTNSLFNMFRQTLRNKDPQRFVYWPLFLNLISPGHQHMHWWLKPIHISSIFYWLSMILCKCIGPNDVIYLADKISGNIAASFLWFWVSVLYLHDSCSIPIYDTLSIRCGRRHYLPILSNVDGFSVTDQSWRDCAVRNSPCRYWYAIK